MIACVNTVAGDVSKQVKEDIKRNAKANEMGLMGLNRTRQKSKQKWYD